MNTPADRDTLARFAALIVDPAYRTEQRLFKAQWASHGHGIVPDLRYSSTLAGWYNDPERLTSDASRLQGTSSYIIPNPMVAELLHKADNKFIKVGKDEAGNDDLVAILRWLSLDFDPPKIRGLADISATDAEREVARAKRDAFFRAHPEFLRAALQGSSGNGWYGFIRLPDYPNDPEHRALIAGIINYLHKQFDVDIKCKNPSRLMCLPGTWKCKGEGKGDRPWRLATLDEVGHGTTAGAAEPFDLKGWAARLGIEIILEGPKAAAGGAAQRKGRAAGGHAGNGHANGDGGANGNGHAPADRGNVLERARRCVFENAASVAGDGGHNKLFGVACALVDGFGLAWDEAMPIFADWNQAKAAPPEGEAQLRHKLEDAYRKFPSPKLHLLNARRAEPAGGNGHAATGPPPPAGAIRPEAEGIRADDDPYRLASLYLMDRQWHADCPRLHYWRGDFHQWDGRCYRPRLAAELRAELTGFVQEEFNRLHVEALVRYRMAEAAGNPRDDKGPPRSRPVTTRLIGDVLQALGAVALLPASDDQSPPFWIGDGPWSPAEMLPAANMLVHLPSLVSGHAHSLTPTPTFFCPHSLDFGFVADAPDPVNWLTFLGALPPSEASYVQHQLWPDDSESIGTLQEWMGLNLVPDTSFEKMAALIGPRRGGKGTISWIMSRLIGGANVAGPTLTSLAEMFGLEPLIGKLSAIIDDAHLSGRADAGIIVERLMTVSGQGRLTINRKHRSAWTGVLPTRFTIISNELPRLSESSGALSGRFILLRFTRSFYGMEDRTLKERLSLELPGILKWAIEGWRRLRERGHFVQPESGRELIDEMEDLASPIGAFLKERCTIGPGHRINVGDLYQAWSAWCSVHGRDKPGNQAIFGRDIRAVLPHLKTRQIWSSSMRVRIFEGIALNNPMAGRESTVNWDEESPAF